MAPMASGVAAASARVRIATALRTMTTVAGLSTSDWNAERSASRRYRLSNGPPSGMPIETPTTFGSGYKRLPIRHRLS